MLPETLFKGNCNSFAREESIKLRSAPVSNNVLNTRLLTINITLLLENNEIGGVLSRIEVTPAISAAISSTLTEVVAGGEEESPADTVAERVATLPGVAGGLA